MNHALLYQKKQIVEGKTIIGIDPAKRTHHTAVLDAHGGQVGKSFSFPVTFNGFNLHLWRNLDKILPDYNTENTIFAVETSCNLWQTLAAYLYSLGYTVVLVSPLSTHHERPVSGHDFSRTDPKDAYLIATLAQRACFDFYRHGTPHSNAMHTLGIAYDKLRKNMAQNRSRLRSQMERIFPEFLTILEPDTDSAQYLLKQFLFPDEFVALNIEQESIMLEKISKRQHGKSTLLRIATLAENSIGVVKTDQERPAERLILNGWIAMIECIETQIKPIRDELIRLAKELPSFERITSLSGVGELLAALFLAEVRDLSRFRHHKMLEKFAGLNLRLSQSGRFIGTRHISHIGNRRLLWIVYRMTEETAKRVPEVRSKYLTRQLKRRKHRKNVIASAPQLLQLILAMDRDAHTYNEHTESVLKMRELEIEYAKLDKQKNDNRKSNDGHPSLPEQSSVRKKTFVLNLKQHKQVV